MKITANQKRQTQAMKSSTKDIDLDIIWNHGSDTNESPHKFTRHGAASLKAAVRAQRNDFPKLQTSAINDTVAAEYADYCAKDLRRASAFIAATWKHDVTSMIANEFKYKCVWSKLPREKTSFSWYVHGSQWLMYALCVGKLMDYLRVAHPNLAEVWEQRIKPLVTNAMNAQSSDGRSKLGDGYTLRIVTYLNSAANQIDEIRNALAKSIERSSIAGQGKENDPKPRGRKRDDREPLRKWINGRNFQLPGKKSKRELAKIISRELETMRPKGVPLVRWAAVERVLQRKETDICWSQNQLKHSAMVRWPQLPHK